MIKAVAHSESGEPLVVLGISKLNVQKLQEGLPILVQMEELGFKGKILILYGETEDSIAAQLQEHMDIDQKIDLRNPGSLQ